ncbi:MAG: glycosyltransferase [Planctomycetes bacterium]|nr:glycosyltransferase [Planctomycetota bacterium]
MADPTLSVVIASCVGPPFITKCLRSLESQRGSGDIEFLVADRAGGEVAAHIEREFPWTKLIRRPAGESVPDLRRHAIASAKADWVAIIEEHCVAEPNWIEVILRTAREPVAAIGGPIADDAYPRIMDWAVYFTEYNSYMPPYERGPSWNVCGANCVYRRDLMQKFLPECGSGYWEAALNSRLLAAGEKFLNEPDLVVRHTGPFGFCYYLHQRYLFSRAFAGIRRPHVSAAFRFAYVFLAPLIVPVLLARTAQRVRQKGRHFGKFLRALPILIPVNITYVFGEWIGFLLGPGDSLSKIE